jgi:hypothetical protein
MKQAVILTVLIIVIVAGALIYATNNGIGLVSDLGSGTDNYTFTIDEGLRADYASNPMVIAQTQESLTLAYESHSTQLKFAPQDKVKLIETTDGVTFNQIENNTNSQVRPPGIKMPNGQMIRYVFQPENGGVFASISTDGTNYEVQPDLVYAASAEDASDAREFGVYTYFLDKDGGVVLLFNSTDDNNDIVVNRAYAAPQTNGLSFDLQATDILDGTLDNELYADPNVLVLNDGTIFLIIMNQTEGAKPPQGKQGTIHGYTSTDDGQTFNYQGQLVGYDDFEEFEIFSLNDPKLVQFADGTIRIYVAGMVKDETAVSEDPNKTFKWILVSISS